MKNVNKTSNMFNGVIVKWLKFGWNNKYGLALVVFLLKGKRAKWQNNWHFLNPLKNLKN